MNRYFQLMVLNFFLLACTQNTDYVKEKISFQNSEVQKEKHYDYSSIKLIDRFDNELKKVTSYNNSEADFSPVYIGEKKKEILLVYKPEKIANRAENWNLNEYKVANSSSTLIPQAILKSIYFYSRNFL